MSAHLSCIFARTNINNRAQRCARNDAHAHYCCVRVYYAHYVCDGVAVVVVVVVAHVADSCSTGNVRKCDARESMRLFFFVRACDDDVK